MANTLYTNSGDGFVKSGNGQLITGLHLNSLVTLSEKQALDAALSYMHASKYLWQNTAMEKELKRQTRKENATYYPVGEVVYAPEGNDVKSEASQYRLSWNFKIYTDDPAVTAQSVYVDAVTGKVIHHVDIAMNCSGATGTSAFNGNVSFNTQLNGSSYRSHDDCQTTDIYVYNCAGGGTQNLLYRCR